MPDKESDDDEEERLRSGRNPSAGCGTSCASIIFVTIALLFALIAFVYAACDAGGYAF